MINNFVDFTSCPLLNMQHIYRYSGVKVSEPESLSSHIVEVQVMGYMIIDTLNNKYGETIDYGTFLEKALHHDLEESLTGDVCRTLKYYNSNVLKELQNVGNEVANGLYAKYFQDYERMLKLWEDAKIGKEGFIVKIADMLCVSTKALREVCLLNNNYFLKVVYEVYNYLQDTIEQVKAKSPYNKEATMYLVDLMVDARNEMKDLWDARKSIADKFSILDTTLLD